MDWYWTALLGVISFFGVFVFCAANDIRKLKEQIGFLETNWPFPCSSKQPLVVVSDPVFRMTFSHVLSCRECLGELERHPEKINDLKLLDSDKKLLKFLLEPIKLKMPPGPK